MRRTIETAPRDGNVIILEDDARGTYDVAHWSPETGEWVGENGEPSKITPSHWYPMQGDNFLQQENDVSTSPARAGLSASRARGHRFVFPFSLRRTAPQRPAASDVIAPRSVASAAPMTVTAVEAPTAPAEAKRRPDRRNPRRGGAHRHIFVRRGRPLCDGPRRSAGDLWDHRDRRAGCRARDPVAEPGLMEDRLIGASAAGRSLIRGSSNNVGLSRLHHRYRRSAFY